MDPKAQTVEEKFRVGLEGVVEIAERLKSVCTTVEELVLICKLALEHDVQLKILMRLTGAKK